MGVCGLHGRSMNVRSTIFLKKTGLGGVRFTSYQLDVIPLPCIRLTFYIPVVCLSGSHIPKIYKSDGFIRVPVKVFLVISIGVLWKFKFVMEVHEEGMEVEEEFLSDFYHSYQLIYF